MFSEDIEILDDYDNIFKDIEGFDNITKSSVKIEDKNKKVLKKEEIIIALLMIVMIAGSLSLYSHWYIFVK